MSANVPRDCPRCGEPIPVDHPYARYWPPTCAQEAKGQAQRGQAKSRRTIADRLGGLHLIGSAKVRRCLRCDAPFPSTWAGHRFCALCRRQSITVDEAALGAPVALPGWPRWAP